MTIWDPDPREETRPLAVLDFEASGMGRRSYPIEVGVAYVATGEIRSWLIRPHSAWDGWEWSDEAEHLHGITRETLAVEGLPPEEVADALAEVVAGHTVLSDSALDDGWLARLYEVGGRTPPFRLEGFSPVVDVLAGGLPPPLVGRPPQAVVDAVAEAERRFPEGRHRAGPDARRLAEVIRLLSEE